MHDFSNGVSFVRSVAACKWCGATERSFVTKHVIYVWMIPSIHAKTEYHQFAKSATLAPRLLSVDILYCSSYSKIGSRFSMAEKRLARWNKA